jgi:hypothetical protein
MSMMIHSVLIVGGTQEERKQKALSIREEKNHLSAKSYQLKANNDPDFIILDSQTSIGIEQVRDLQKTISRKPFQAPFKIAFIPAAQNLTGPAQNALLKTLEEPPLHTIIILSAPSADNLLPTIVSRCQLVTLPSKNQFESTPKDLNQLQVLICKIVTQSPGERFLTVQPFTKSREEAINFCQQAVLAAHELLKKTLDNSKKRQRAAKIAESLTQALELLQKNINTKLVLENMVLGW